ncbi:MAG: phosphopantetheine-binding protein [Deltaproteobacteria bacterium]|nr:phosphopantetheine-binding protein [Deltaproteobacteria bacterium]MCL5792253.1 phosphopantetheine-binding protein [Deltaproteobacteria bacterium]
MAINTNNLTVKDIERRVSEIFIDELKLEDVTPETLDTEMHLMEELGIDSMDLITVVLVLKGEFAINIEEADYPRLTNIRLISEYIKEKMENGRIV